MVAPQEATCTSWQPLTLATTLPGKCSIPRTLETAPSVSERALTKTTSKCSCLLTNQQTQRALSLAGERRLGLRARKYTSQLTSHAINAPCSGSGPLNSVSCTSVPMFRSWTKKLKSVQASAKTEASARMASASAERLTQAATANTRRLTHHPFSTTSWCSCS